MDIDAIPLGVDFRDHIKATISGANALLVVTGPRWLGKKKTGSRIQESSDWVRIELEAAFESKISVFPVLVDGATMPKPEQLPPSIRGFAYLQAGRVDSGVDFHPHIDRLIRSIDVTVATKARLETSTVVDHSTPAGEGADVIYADQPPRAVGNAKIFDRFTTRLAKWAAGLQRPLGLCLIHI